MDEESVFVLEIPYETVDFKGTTVNISELCCYNGITQYSNRMGEGCEDSLHDIASKYSSESSLDAIIKVCKNGTEKDIFDENKYEIIDDIEGYASDHKCIKASLQNKSKGIDFDLMSYNIEGLCKKPGNNLMFRKRLNNFYKTIGKKIRNGFILCIQELSLQQDESLKLAHETISLLTKDLKKNFPGVKSSTDGYTGCVCYDSSVWTLRNIIDIERTGSKKKSNAYHFTCEGGEIWVINIHLKALLSTCSPKFCRIYDPDNIHAEELNNILNKVNEENKNFEVPVYLCGDYNNPSNDKELLIKNSLLYEKKQEKWFGGWFN